MMSRQIAAILLKNPGLAIASADSAISDRELLRRFADVRDEGAFTLLVWRHGALVWRVCRGIVANDQDAEDVFQATFLVLARKASSSGWRDSVANWLYETAYRLARKARSAGRRQAARLGQLEGRLLRQFGGSRDNHIYPVASSPDGRILAGKCGPRAMWACGT